MQEIWARSLGWEDALKKEKATHSSILAWRIYSPCGHKESLWGLKVLPYVSTSQSISYGVQIP